MDEQIDTPEDDDLALKTRREALRAFVNDVAAHVQTLQLPETYLEAERACRCVTIHDRVIQTLPLIAGDALLGDAPGEKPDAVLKPIRRHLRVYADRVMETTAALPKPASFLEGERAGRYALACDRMLTQLYTAPKAVTAKPGKRFRNPDGIWMTRDEAHDNDEGESEDDPDFDWREDALKTLDRITDPNYVWDESEEGPDLTIGWRGEAKARLNQLSKEIAEETGFWPTGEPYDPADPYGELYWGDDGKIGMPKPQSEPEPPETPLPETPLIETYLEAVDAGADRERLDESRLLLGSGDNEAELSGSPPPDPLTETGPSIRSLSGDAGRFLPP